MGDVLIQPGDLILGDRDGVVAAPAADAAAAVAAGEARKIELIRQGARTIDLYGFADGAPAEITPGAPFRGRR